MARWFNLSSAQLLQNFARHERANTAVIFALAAPVLLAAVGAGVDFSLASRLKASLQGAADAGAVAGASEMTLGKSANTHIVDVAMRFAKSNLELNNIKNADVTAALTVDRTGVEVAIRQTSEAFFSKILSTTPPVVSVKAVAKADITEKKICVLGLDASSPNTVSLDSNSRLTANDCGVYSNSKNSAGLRSQSNAILKAQLICSAGGRIGGESNFYPRPMLDCPSIKDPLASRPSPPIGACKATSMVIKHAEQTLTPGTYCKGLTIEANAKVRLLPGVYVIKDGPLVVDSNAELTGDYTGLFFTGTNTYFKFTSNAVVNLSAPKDGPMAGLLIFEDRNNPLDTKFTITSNSTRKLLGTIYMPRGLFVVHANNRVADQSAYTVIVARRIDLSAGPNLIVNSNYDKTDVPVPAGLGRIGGTVRLTN